MAQIANSRGQGFLWAKTSQKNTRTTLVTTHVGVTYRGNKAEFFALQNVNKKEQITF